jgi:hypothetical protein
MTADLFIFQNYPLLVSTKSGEVHRAFNKDKTRG